MSKDLILPIYLNSKTVFSLQEIVKLFPNISYKNLKRRLSYYVTTGRLKKLRKNVYAKMNYNPLEVPQKPYLTSYISLESVLEKEKSSIFSVSYISRTINVDGNKIVYRKLPKKVFSNKKEIKETDGYFIASPERAFTDAVYIYKNYHFNDLKSFDWEKIMELKNIYKNRAFERRINRYFKFINKQNDVIPVKTGIQERMDSRLRGNDKLY